MLAPPELRAVHPLGKSPVITDGDLVLAESGAILEYLADKYADRASGELAGLTPKPATPEHRELRFWMHYAEGSAMLPLMLNMYVGRLGEGGAPLAAGCVAQAGDRVTRLN